MISEAINQPIKEFGQQLGLLYKRWVLDCISEIGHSVSVDFSYRPELYKKVGDKTASQITAIQGQYGYTPNFPNKDIRLMLMKPIFGGSDSQMNRNDGSAFQTARMPVLAAAAGSAVVPFRRFMEDLEGDSLSQTDIRISNIFNTAVSILKDPGVAAVFGIGETIDDKWPLDSTDAEGAKLIEKITTQLSDMSYGIISRDKFVGMQRIAEKGQQSILRILETDIESNDETLDLFSAQAFAWGSDLKLVGGVRPQ